jgi:thymidylate synthase (FAD)
MNITLENYTPLQIASKAIRSCWASYDKSDSKDGKCGELDKKLIYRVGNQYKHSSTLEHLYYNFYIEGISRAVLQELARHRVASLSVKSTRYTLKELKNEDEFNIKNKDKANKYIVLTKDDEVDEVLISSLENLRLLAVSGKANDIIKYALPECYKTSLAWSINARSLQNFLQLRTAKSALWEIRELAYNIYDIIPNEHKYLFEEFVYDKK